MQGRKILYILRHAKTETGSPSQDDHSRALTPAGIQSAQAMGKYLAGKALPERVICSTAKRTRQTWEEMEKALPATLPVAYSDALYLASAGDMLNLLSSVGEDVSSLLLIGHNPGLHQLALALAAEGEDTKLDRLALMFPPCALAVFSLSGEWSRIRQASGELKEFIAREN